MTSFTRRLLASGEAYRHYRSQSGLVYKMLRRLARLRHVGWSFLTHSDISPHAKLGQRLQLPHPNGIVIHEDAVVGDDCMIMQQVTIGMIGDGEVPVIGNGVYVGAGAKIIGKVHVGDGARIGANAVVTKDVPPGHTAIGVPAKIIPNRSERAVRN
jgi:serine O-acetyltransferase